MAAQRRNPDRSPRGASLVQTCVHDPAAQSVRAVAWRSAQEGVGNAGCPRTRSRVRKVESTRVSHHGYAGTPGIPARNGFNGFLRTLPGDRALLSPSPHGRFLPRNLTPTIEASGPHDFAVRKITRSSVAQLASIASQPYVRDDRETPLCIGPGCDRYRRDLGEMGTRIFLRRGTGLLASA